MQIVEVLPVDQKVQHVVALSAHLQPGLHPIQSSSLEKFGTLKRTEQIPTTTKKTLTIHGTSINVTFMPFTT